MRLLATVIFLFGMVFNSSGQEELLKKLEGTWLSEKNAKQGESWVVDGDFLRGQSFMIKENGDTTIWEKLSIHLIEPLYYEADVKSNPKPVRFLYKKGKGNKLLFENLEHDFPTHIEYTFIGENNLEAKVYNATKHLVFKFKRKTS